MGLRLSSRPPFELARNRGDKRPRIQVRASEDRPATEWGSLLADLSRSHAPDDPGLVEWRVHDKTHLEFAIDYELSAKPTTYVWEAFFFVPESFRLPETTYDKRQIYDDLLSYVRLAVPEQPFAELARACEAGGEAWPLASLTTALAAARGKAEGSPEAALAVRRARLFACRVRASGLAEQRAMLDDVAESSSAAAASTRAARFIASARHIAHSYRAVVAEADADLPDEVRVAVRWVDEDLSLFLEALAATASVHLHETATPELASAASTLAAEAVEQARYRTSRGYPSVGAEDATPALVEHIEFRRHMLKRFTSSVLWLEYEIRDATTWIVHGLYGLAAAVAMAFAVVVAVRATQMQNYLSLYAALLVASYVVKDRLKAILQSAFSRWAQRNFADRAWRVLAADGENAVATVAERAGLRDFSRVPEEALAARRLTREHALEEFARPENVLWHEKRIAVDAAEPDEDFRATMITEIFRLNLASWLAHTDDPTRTITFADPDAAVVCSVDARRVYNINVVYRLARGNEPAEWRRIRVVVSRKGILRIEPIA